MCSNSNNCMDLSFTYHCLIRTWNLTVECFIRASILFFILALHPHKRTWLLAILHSCTIHHLISWKWSMLSYISTQHPCIKTLYEHCIVGDTLQIACSDQNLASWQQHGASTHFASHPLNWAITTRWCHTIYDAMCWLSDALAARMHTLHAYIGQPSLCLQVYEL